ncbi:DnaA N-terminal domain-containing protein [Sphingopyxis macrogoltabida]|uniref:DnaA N-terminal domain-containing protein n=1 Tax=Sphingopyxis macrogoltabida TaxID=33050 RepID=A0A0N9USI8_SPHMC|nr:DnaA N-terminal domain-containing protein [Sphingopyxis macrogoltabida]ALH82921.1 hypothetical protein AN936_21950 [Sphingopyxis macrogoltabida]
MSNHLITECYKRKLGSVTRLAMMAYLADKAADCGGGIYASKQTMADELDLTKKTVITTIQGLIADGLLIAVGTKPCANGHTVDYAIVVDALLSLPLVGCWERKARFTGVNSSPVKRPDRSRSDTGTGVAATPKPSLEPFPLSSADADDPPHEEKGAQHGKEERPAPKRKARERKPGHRLPPDWEAPAPEDLPPVAARLVAQWPDGAYEAVCEAFKLNWLAETRAIGCKSDWTAALGKWVNTDHPRVMHAKMRGVSFAPPPAARPAVASALPPAPVRAKSREDGRSARVHAALEQELGPTTYSSWVKGAAILFGEDAVTVVCASPFAAGWVENNLAIQIGAAVAAASGSVVGRVVFQAEASTPAPRQEAVGG